MVGEDPRPTFLRARGILVACDAHLYVPEVEAELAEEGLGA